jgi:hypothetical protein
MAGRPRVEIDDLLVSEYRLRRMSWRWIYDDLSISKSAFESWKLRIGFVDPLPTNISDEELNNLIYEYQNGYPDRGEVSTVSYLRALGVNVVRQRVRDSIGLVDNAGREFRTRRLIPRVVYYVAGPHHLWHIDGNHKLIRYKIVVHGCIDGNTRAIMYIHAADNNRSATNIEYFKQAVSEYQLPYYC